MRRSAILLSAAVGFLAGCGDSPSEPDWSALLQELETRRAAWEATRPPSYTMVQQHDCPCPPERLRPAIVSVTNEAVTGAVWEEDGSPVGAADLAIFLSVREVFDLVQNVAEANVPGLRVDYHPQLGYPALVLIDYARAGTDDDRLIQIVDLAAQP